MQRVDKLTIWQMLQEKVPDAAVDAPKWKERFGDLASVEVEDEHGNVYYWERSA